jgi:tripartite-type tricarboxylate transporter receptor subunit TctC
VKLLNTRLQAILASEDVKKRLVADGADAALSSAEDYAKLIAADLSQWGEAVQASGAKLD